MAAEGAIVAAADIDRAAAERTAADCNKAAAATAGGRSRSRPIAAMSRASIAMIARAVAELGRLDVIVNNAGVTRYRLISWI